MKHVSGINNKLCLKIIEVVLLLGDIVGLVTHLDQFHVFSFKRLAHYFHCGLVTVGSRHLVQPLTDLSRHISYKTVDSK